MLGVRHLLPPRHRVVPSLSLLADEIRVCHFYESNGESLGKKIPVQNASQLPQPKRMAKSALIYSKVYEEGASFSLHVRCPEVLTGSTTSIRDGTGRKGHLVR